MYTINVKSHINASPAKLLKIWRNPKILLKYATSIKKLEIIKREKNRLLTAWEVEFDKLALKWRQWDVLDTTIGIINFKLDSGDFARYHGVWTISPSGENASTLTLEAAIDWGIPKLEMYVKKSLERKTRLLFKKFLQSIKKIYSHG